MSANRVSILVLAACMTTAAHSTGAQSRTVASTVYATFEKKGEKSELIGLAVGNIAAGTKVTLNCSGTSCPFAKKEVNLNSTVSMLALTDMFVDPVLPPGMTLEIRVTRSGMVGKVFQYEIRHPGEPRVTSLCLPPDADKPVAC
jgi:hypothetical protein